MDMKTNAEEMEKWLNSPIPKRVINEWKKEKLLGFSNNEFRILITKTKIASFGINY